LFPTTDGRTLILSRYTELTADQKMLVRQLRSGAPAAATHHRAKQSRPPANAV
jgi:hypothetical protein